MALRMRGAEGRVDGSRGRGRMLCAALLGSEEGWNSGPSAAAGITRLSPTLLTDECACLRERCYCACAAAALRLRHTRSPAWNASTPTPQGTCANVGPQPLRVAVALFVVHKEHVLHCDPRILMQVAKVLYLVPG